jgi:LemA protein
MWELLIPVALVGGGIMIYNGLVKARVQVDGAWADIDVQLKRRHDLVPNVVETVKGYAGHERETLEAVVKARSAAMSAQGPVKQAEAENMLTGALKSLFALSEAYPDLQAAGNFKAVLQRGCEGLQHQDRPGPCDYHGQSVQLRQPGVLRDR